MRVRLTHCTVRRSGAIAKRDELLSVESLLIGRGTDNHLALSGLTISIHHATIRQQGAKVVIEAEPGRDLRVNGRPRASAKLRPRNVVQIGHFELRVVAPSTNEDLALEIFESATAGAELTELQKRTTRQIERGWVGRRRLSWAAVISVVALCLAAPFVSPRLESIWQTGAGSDKHAFFGHDCSACHQAFEPVRDASCLECHNGIGGHTQADAEVGELAASRCASCHTEHDDGPLSEIDQALCSGCHGDLLAHKPESLLPPATDFAERHPDFRLFVVETPGSGERRGAVWSADLRENSGVRFSHLRHVGQPVKRVGEEPEHLRCDTCHRLDDGGKYMRPIAFETHCGRCHELGFDERLPDAMAPHGDPVRMREAIARIYSDAVLRGEVKDPRAPRAVRLARPGRELTSKEARVVSEWVDQQVDLATETLMLGPGECARCHELSDQAAEDGGLDLEAVEIADVWMPKSEFQHRTHLPFPCADCHPAAAVYAPDDDVRVERPAWSQSGARPYGLQTREELKSGHGLEPSEDASDVLIPQIDRCQSCHSGKQAQISKVRSECVMCHPFHRDESPPMKAAEKVERFQNSPIYNLSSARSGAVHAPASGDADETRDDLIASDPLFAAHAGGALRP